MTPPNDRWQPIETAPKPLFSDEDIILWGYDPKVNPDFRRPGIFFSCTWLPGPNVYGGFDASDGFLCHIVATHWMSMPRRPE